MIFSRLRFDGGIESGCGTFIILNREGWIVTAAHVVRDISLIQQHKIEIAQYNDRCRAIEEDQKLNPKQKRKRLGQIDRNPAWVMEQAIFWGITQCCLINVAIDEPADLAIGQLEPFDASWVEEYPVLKNPSEPMPTGTSLCRLGFPFHEIRASYDHSTRTFSLGEGVLPVPRFPNDGIHTRVVLVPTKDRSRTVKFIETSTPGLRGQSGGPIFDTNGHVWAIQSQTNSFQLGFTPSVKIGGKEIVEHQFMHVGWGTHVEELINFLRAKNIAVSLSS